MIEFLYNHKTFLVYIPFYCYWIFLFIITTIPGSYIDEFVLNDKLNHFFAFFVLSILMNLTLKFQKRYPAVSKKHYLFSLILCGSYALFDELHQMYIPGRYADFYDWIADFTGAVLGVFIVFMLLNRKTALK